MIVKFPESLLFILIVGSLIAIGIATVILLIMLVRDIKAKKLW